jgi:hypothetical protein
MLRRFVVNYIERHRHPLNQVLHLIGVPLTFIVSVVFLIQGKPLWALGAFIGGYLLQFAGHVIEGNDAGEVVLIKRSLGMSYNEFGHLSKQSDSHDPSADT